MSTITTEQQDITAVPPLAEGPPPVLRRLRISVCGTATRIPSEDHFEDECRARGHSVCVVCEEFVAAMGFGE